MTYDTSELNAAQSDAVNCTRGPLLVLAGAGSGKTKVLTHRIAHILDSNLASPHEVLAITFTNKAAAEMKSRLGDLCKSAARSLWVMTFHSMCARMLRQHAGRLSYTPGFTIYDADDSKRLLKSAMASAGIDEKRYPVNGVVQRISTAKNELVSCEACAASAVTPMDKAVANVFPVYQSKLAIANAMDFDDLLVQTHRLLRDHSDILEAYQERFRYILVDEYQDTNHAQYSIVKLLASKYRNLMVVGDDDQSIYSWRGADIRNILEFEKDYPEATVIRLEQNYRSTETILLAANAVVANNIGRKPKTLWTANVGGEAITCYIAGDERDEARFIASQVEALRVSEGLDYSDFAIFYRTNAQSRVIEDALLRAGVPYQIVGGTRFFDRAEIRDVMAYLKLVVNPADEISLKRVINKPKRGIGKTTLDRIEQVASSEGQALESVLLRCAAGEFGTAVVAKIRPFTELLAEIRGDAVMPLRDRVEAIIERSGLLAELAAEGTPEAASRVENIREFLGVVDEYVSTHTSSTDPTGPDSQLAQFMEWLALRTDLDSMPEGHRAVTLMTVHTAKGLEFPVVFIAGLEDTLFPHANSMFDPSGLEEERRLIYVAITRARQRLYLTYSRTRSLYGSTRNNPASRFIAEIPPECMRVDRSVSHGQAAPRAVSGSPLRHDISIDFAVGDSVEHKVFGLGVVKQMKGDRITVDFGDKGIKKLMAGFAPLRKVLK